MFRSLKNLLQKILSSVLNPAILRGLFKKAGKVLRAVGKGVWSAMKKVFHALRPILKMVFWPFVFLLLLLRRKKHSSEDAKQHSEKETQSVTEKVLYEREAPSTVDASSNKDAANDAEKHQKKDTKEQKGTVSTFVAETSQSKSNKEEEKADKTQSIGPKATVQKEMSHTQKSVEHENTASSQENTKNKARKEAQSTADSSEYSERRAEENRVRASSATQTRQTEENVQSRVESVAVADVQKNAHSTEEQPQKAERNGTSSLFGDSAETQSVSTKNSVAKQAASASEKQHKQPLVHLRKKNVEKGQQEDMQNGNSENEETAPQRRKKVFARLAPRFARKKTESTAAKKHTTKEQYTLPTSLPLERITMEETGESSSVSFTLGEVIDETRATAGINPYSEPLFR